MKTNRSVLPFIEGALMTLLSLTRDINKEISDNEIDEELRRLEKEIIELRRIRDDREK